MKVRDIAPYGVRMPAELKERLQDLAKTNGRSLNTEIVRILTEYIDFDDTKEIVDGLRDKKLITKDGKPFEFTNEYEFINHINDKMYFYKHGYVEAMKHLLRGDIDDVDKAEIIESRVNKKPT